MSYELDECPFYTAVLATSQRLAAERPEGASLETIGALAWGQLTAEQQADQARHVLGLYARTVLDEERMRVLDAAAEDRTHTYLDVLDTAMAWESAHDRPDDEGCVPVSKSALLNVLCELELLQHRLDMREGGR